MHFFKSVIAAALLTGFVYADGVAEGSDENYQNASAQPQPLCSESYTQVTGFYAGVDLGLSNLKNKMSKKKTIPNETETIVRTNKKKNGFAGDLFCGYNFQMGRFIVGLECLLGMASAKPVTVIKDNDSTTLTNKTYLSEPGESVSLKRKYTFGFVPRFGYAIFGGFNAYVNLGTTFSKYAMKHHEKKGAEATKSTNKNKGKASLLVGLGVEQNFGSLFVRAECNKTFKRNIAEIGATKIGSEAYIVKIGAGYRF